MSLMIDASRVEDRLKRAAAERGIKPSDLAVEILSDQLGFEAAGESKSLPFYATATPEQWVEEFNKWVDGHPKRIPLPERAFDRTSLYEGRP